MPSSARRVLLVEDEPADALIAEHILSIAADGQYILTTCSTLAEALAACQRRPIDIALVDQELPDATGVEAIDALSVAAPDVAIIALTSADALQDIRAAYAAGAVDHLAKRELSAENLARAMRHALVRSRVFAQMRSVVAAAADATLVAYPDGELRFANPVAIKVLGLPEDCAGKPTPFPLKLSKVAEVHVVGPDGGERTLEQRCQLIDWRGEPAILATLRDVTEAVEAAKLRQRLADAEKAEELAQVALSLAHEINNPAAIIHLNLRMAEDEIARLKQLVVHDEEQERLEEIRQMTGESLRALQRIVAAVRSLRDKHRASGAFLPQDGVLAALQNEAPADVNHPSSTTNIAPRRRAANVHNPTDGGDERRRSGLLRVDQPLRVLVVDDDARYGQAVARMLGARALNAGCGVRARSARRDPRGGRKVRRDRVRAADARDRRGWPVSTTRGAGRRPAPAHDLHDWRHLQR